MLFGAAVTCATEGAAGGTWVCQVCVCLPYLVVWMENITYTCTMQSLYCNHLEDAQFWCSKLLLCLTSVWTKLQVLSATIGGVFSVTLKSGKTECGEAWKGVFFLMEWRKASTYDEPWPSWVMVGFAAEWGSQSFRERTTRFAQQDRVRSVAQSSLFGKICPFFKRIT